MTAPTRAPWEAIATRIAEALKSSEIDLVQAFCVGEYNRRLASAEWRLPDAGEPNALGLVIGNTRAMWPRFREALARDATLRAAGDPIETYIEARVQDALRAVSLPAIALWAHNRGQPLAIQRIAHAAGLAHLSPSHLSIHPVHGPWIALRAVIIVAVAAADAGLSDPHDPCTACAKPCLAALERALQASGGSDPTAVEREWTAWVKVRDVCPEGRASRYDDEQIRYHYSKLRETLHQ